MSRNPQFKNFLNENINLITILGIFNGLSIYSTTIDDESSKYALGFVFTLISILILRELILSIPEDEGLYLPMISFMVGLCSVWLYLIYILFKNYTSISNMVFAWLCIGFFMWLAANILKSTFLKKIEVKHPRSYKVIFWLVVTAFIIFGFIIWLKKFEISQSLFEFIPKKKITY